MKKTILLLITFVGFISATNAQWKRSGLDSLTICSIAGKGDSLIAGTSANCAYMSPDNGRTWRTANSGIMYSWDCIGSLAAYGGSRVYAGTVESGIYLTDDFGANWTSLKSMFSSSMGNSPTVSAIASTGLKIFAGTSAGVFSSTDDGVTWIEKNTGLSGSVTAMEYYIGRIYTGTWTGGVFLSTDDGNNWTAVNTGLTDTLVHALSAVGNDIFVSTDMGGVFMSSNNGGSWVPVNTGLSTSHAVKAFAVSYGGILFAGTDGAGVLWYSFNDNQWYSANTGLTNLSVYSLTIDRDTLFAGCQYGGVWKRSITDILSTNCSAQFTMIPDSVVPHHYYAVNYSSGTAPLSYLWNWGDGTYDTIAYPSHTYSSAGFYNICLTINNSNGCSDTFCDSTYVQKSTNTVITVDVIPPGTLGINENGFSEDIKIFPNPATDNITISGADKIAVEILNTNGQVIKMINDGSKRLVIDLKGFARGVYIVKVKSDKGIAVKKIIKE